MKKYFIVLCIFVLVLTLSSCEHEHTYSSEWSHHETAHWHEATCDDTVEKKDFAAHTWVFDKVLVAPSCDDGGKDQHKCSVCEATKEVATEKNGHSFTGSYQSDDEYHWVKCDNCDEKQQAKHSGGQPSFTKKAVCETCSKEYGELLVLNPVSNVYYNEGILTFDGVEYATSYQVVIKKNNVEVVSTTTDINVLSLSTYDLAGNYCVEIYSIAGDYKLETPATYSLTVLSKVEDIVIEAEIGLQAYANMYKGNELAHGGAYVGNIDNCGQGVTLSYFCYIAGEYSIDAYYTTGSVGSYHNVYVNGVKQARFDYTKNTGWGSATLYNAAKATATITLQKGWNSIVVIKDGNESDNWGGFAELDYFVVKGTGEAYNVDDYTEYNLNDPVSYRLEAEQASFIGRLYEGEYVKWVFNNLVPTYVENASSKYMVGGIDNVGQGLEWHIAANEGGKYLITIVYAYDVWDGANDNVSLSLYHSTAHLRDQALTMDAINQFKVNDIAIDANWNGWWVPVVNSVTYEIDLVAGDNFIYLTKEIANVWCQIDYIELTLIR